MSETTILIVEDEAIVAADLASRLEKLGYAVAGIAARGQDAIALVAREQPQLVLMDIYLAGSMDGIATAEAIQETHDVPVIYLTAHSDAATLSRAKLTEPFGFILKPFDIRELATQIELALYKHRVERQLRESEERYRSIFDNTHAAMLLVDAKDDGIIDVNPAACRYYGYSKAAMTALKMADINVLSTEQIAGELPSQGETRHCRRFQKHRLSDGRVRAVEVFCGPLAIDGRELVFSIIHDISDRKQAEEALERSRDTLDAVVENLDVGVMIADAQGRLRSMNTAALAMHEFASRDEMLTQAAMFADLFELRDLDGHLLPPEEWPSMRAMKGDHFKDLEVSVQNLQTGRRWIGSWSVSPVYNRQGEVDLLVYSVRDITARKKAEDVIRRSNQELEQFAYVASHDLQAPLRAMVGFLQLLEQDYRDRLDAEGQHYIERAVTAGHRMQRMIQDLLSLSQASSSRGRVAATDLNQLVRTVLTELEPALQAKKVQVTCADLPTLKVEANQIARLFQNLVMNAAKYNQSPQPKIAIESQRVRDGYHLQVRDNGIGIAPQFHERIFKVFQRLHTAQEYEGTGLGLALCQTIVERHGGTIWVSSQLNEGATFHFTLPCEGGFA